MRVRLMAMCRGNWLRRGTARAAALGAAAVLTLDCGPTRQTAPASAARAPGANVLLITVDTLRADHLPAYGYRAAPLPAFERLGHEGVTFKAAYAAVPLTLPSHATMLTGLLPPVHGVRDNGGFYLEPERATLATELKRRGYSTAAFVSAFVLDRRWGLASGFDHYYDDFPVSLTDLAAMARVQRRGSETWLRAKQWIGGHAGDRFFVWLHLFDPHTPYDPPDPFRTRFPGRPYEGEIAYVDAILSEVIAELTARSLLENTVVVLVSDHGEGLGEHDEDEHGLLAYDSTLHVPWIIRLPNRALQETAVEQPVSLVDVMPTILELVGAPVPTGIDGRSAARLMGAAQTGGGDALYAETLYPRLHFGWSELLSARNDRFKLIRGPRLELYDYRADPGETVNLAESRRDVTARLDQILTRIVSTQGSPVRPTDTGKDASARLKALGYFSGSPPPVPPGPLADPRDKTQSFRRLTRARELLEKGQDAEATRLLEQLLTVDPDLEPAHRALRDSWISRGKTGDAERWFERRLAERPDDVRLLVDLAFVARQAGKPDRAVAALDRALARRGDDVEALVLAGEIHRDQRHLDVALRHFTRASESAPSDNTIRIQIAQTLFAMGRVAEAETSVSAAMAADPRTAGLHYLLAQIAETRRDGARAEREYRAEIAQSPWDYRARFNLALLLGQRGAHAEELEMLQSIPTLAPQFADVHFFIAKAILDAGDSSRFPAAIDAARRGLELAPQSPSAPLGHYVLADIYRIQGRAADSGRELRLGRELESRLAPSPRR